MNQVTNPPFEDAELIALVKHMLRYSEIEPDLFNKCNHTDFSKEELEAMWNQFCSSKAPLAIEGDQTPAIYEQDIAYMQEFAMTNFESRYESELHCHKRIPERNPVFLRYKNNISTSERITTRTGTLQEFLTWCELEFEILQELDKIPGTSLAIVHSLKTIIITGRKQLVLPVFSPLATQTNAVIFYDESAWWLANCGFDGSEAERIGVEVNGVSMKNGERVMLGDEKVVFRVAGQWFLWRKLPEITK